MTSKEALESIRNEYYTENGRKIVVIGNDDKRFDIVEKDLEILEILKKVAIQYETIAEIINLGGEDCYTIGDKDKIFFTLDNKDEYEIIKRWLGNDK